MPKSGIDIQSDDGGSTPFLTTEFSNVSPCENGNLQLATIFHGLFKRAAAIQRHLQAPLVRERVVYLQAQLEKEICFKSVRDTAEVLLHVIRPLALTSLRRVGRCELKEAGKRWAQETLKHRPAGESRNSARRFFTAGRGWLRFHGLYDLPEFPSEEFFSMYSDFIDAVNNKMGYRRSTISGAESAIKRFLVWAAQRRAEVSSISLDDIDAYLIGGRNSGWRPSTICCQCQALRRFFRYAESRGWCKFGLAGAIQSPTVKKRDSRVSGPRWKQIRRLIDNLNDSDPKDCRAKVVFLLCSVYGLRNVEVAGLRLEDFDWQHETVVVTRAKGGRSQQFPIQYEVEEAIIHYLKTARPRCTCRNLLVTLVRPYRPLRYLASPVQKELMKAGIVSQTYGPHSLRHACATELLRKGSSLRDIADFLGHRSLRSVSIYAKFDLRSLRRVANFSLAGFV